MEPEETLGQPGEDTNSQETPETGESVDLVDLIHQPAWKTILVDLVKREKMDPWDIDVADLADKYLEKINQLEKKDLRIPANAFLACAILLKMKARSLKISSLEEWEEEWAADGKVSEQEKMFFDESAIPELRSSFRAREGKVSLDQLVLGIESILEKTKKTAYKDRDKELPKFDIPYNLNNIDEKIDDVFKKISERVDSQGLVLFSALLDEKNPLEMINTFVPVLFLMNKGKIVAWQEQFFGEIFISLKSEEKKERKE